MTFTQLLILLLGVSLVAGVNIWKPTDLPAKKKFVYWIILALGLSLAAGHRYATFPQQPQTTLKLEASPANYATELEVAGIPWKTGFKRYILQFRNERKSAELSDVLLNFYWPAAVIKATVLPTALADGVIIVEEPGIREGMARLGGNTVREFKQGHANSFQVVARRLPPGASIDLDLIVRHEKILIDRGIVQYVYHYPGWGDARKVAVKAYRMPVANDSIIIDKNQPLEGEYSVTKAFLPENDNEVTVLAIEIPVDDRLWK